MEREERKEYTAFVNTLKNLLRKGAVIECAHLNEKDQAFFDAAKLELQDGAYCD